MDERDDAKQPQELSAIPDHVQSASAAVLLSPPVRKSHQMEEEVLDTRMQTGAGMGLFWVRVMVDTGQRSTTVVS